MFDEGELEQSATVAKYATVQTEGACQVERQIEYYNLDVIISVGYRVKSLRGTQFRQWATKRLNEYIRKGFTLDDERLKNGGGRYFRELLQRIRDIRSSERNAKFITYMNVFGNLSVNMNITDRVKVGKDEHQNSAKYLKTTASIEAASGKESLFNRGSFAF